MSSEMVTFETHPDRYRHWQLSIDGAVATLTMDVEEDVDEEEYRRKLNSYDLNVDIELADAVQRLRFEHPEVRAVVVTSCKPRVFCAGANIMMLRSSTHAFKVNFCKFTNETRLAIETASAEAGQTWLAAVNGTCAGGGYELALACDEIVLIDDGSSAVSLPEVPLLGVLPGTGGLTRVVDKRKVRRDRADIFCTVAEGIKGRRAKEWGLVDALVPRSRFDDAVAKRVEEIVEANPPRATEGVAWTPLELEMDESGYRYTTLSVEIDAEARVATLMVRGPEDEAPSTAEEARAQGVEFWPMRFSRELDDALLRLRFNHLDIGLILVKSEGDFDRLATYDAMLLERGDDWFLNEVVSHLTRTLRRFELTSRSFFTLATPGSCFGGTLLELALSSDRAYAMDDIDETTELELSEINLGTYPMTNGLSRLEARLYGEPGAYEALRENLGRHEAMDAADLGLVTEGLDDLDWEVEIPVIIEERASYSPDALTGMEASLRFVGPETMATKIFGRLSAWQNWIFQRPNAVGETGALQSFGQPTRPEFDWRRV